MTRWLIRTPMADALDNAGHLADALLDDLGWRRVRATLRRAMSPLCDAIDRDLRGEF